MGEFHSQIRTAVQKLIEENKLRFNKQNNLTTGSRKSPSEVILDFIYHYCEDLTRFQVSSIPRGDVAQVIRKVEIAHKAAKINQQENLIQEALDDPQLKNHVVFKDLQYSGGKISGCEDFIIIDKTTGKIDPNLTPASYESLIRRFLDKDAFAKFLGQVPLAVKKFLPYRILETKEDKVFRSKISHFDGFIINSCLHPDYRYKSLSEAQQLPEKDIEFIRSVFKDEDSYKYFIDWAHHSIIDRCATYLCFIGLQGTGKSTLIEILTEMHGGMSSPDEGMLTPVKKSGTEPFKSKFNAIFHNARLIEMDEITIDTKEEVNNAKNFQNVIVPIEKKGKDPITAPNFASCVISSNRVKDFRGWDINDRLFSTLEITDKPTHERGFGYSWMSEFKKRIYTQDWKLSFWKFLNENISGGFESNKPFKSDMFYKITFENMPIWKRALVDLVTFKEFKIVTIEDLRGSIPKEHHSKIPSRHADFYEFIETYRHGEDKLRLGHYLKARTLEDSYILVSEHFQPTNKETQVQEKDNL